MLAGLTSLNCRQNLSCLIDKILRKLPFLRMVRKGRFNSHMDASRSLAISLQELSINILARSSFVCWLISPPSNSKDLSLEKSKNRELKIDFFSRHSDPEMSLTKQMAKRTSHFPQYREPASVPVNTSSCLVCLLTGLMPEVSRACSPHHTCCRGFQK